MLLVKVDQLEINRENENNINSNQLAMIITMLTIDSMKA